MNHWDLIPGQTVTLVSGGVRNRGYLLFRDTARAAFMVENGAGEMEWKDFELQADGTLQHTAKTLRETKPDHGRTHVVVIRGPETEWRIVANAPRPNTRFWLSDYKS